MEHENLAKCRGIVGPKFYQICAIFACIKKFSISLESIFNAKFELSDCHGEVIAFLLLQYHHARLS